jgi:hypothetical protein
VRGEAEASSARSDDSEHCKSVQRASRAAKVNSIEPPCREKSHLDLMSSAVRPSYAFMNRKETTHAHLSKSLDGVLASPLPGRRLIPGPVGLVDVCNLGYERVVGVGVGQHRADAQQHCAHINQYRHHERAGRRPGEKHTLADGERGAPLVSQDVQADASVRVDVGVVDAGGEVDLRGLEGVVGGEVDCEEKDTSRVWRVAGTHDGRLPVELSRRQ